MINVGRVFGFMWAISKTNGLIKSQVRSFCSDKIDKRKDFCQGLYMLNKICNCNYDCVKGILWAWKPRKCASVAVVVLHLRLNQGTLINILQAVRTLKAEFGKWDAGQSCLFWVEPRFKARVVFLFPLWILQTGFVNLLHRLEKKKYKIRNTREYGVFAHRFTSPKLCLQWQIL